MTHGGPDLIVWDFDGVLNRNLVDGRFVWADDLEADLGLSRSSLDAYIFRSGRIRTVIVGEERLVDVAAEWLATQDTDISADAFLSYWFAKDAHPDAEVVRYLRSHPARHVIGTNNPACRARFIEADMGFASLVEHVFASGRMGVAKPDAAYFKSITDWSGVPAARTLLVDDSALNCEAARALGWQAFHFTDATRHLLPQVLT
ncbi:HAD family hydrolase [Hasllibacter sp. MH4015]|uniref:HAD family hydrolase n=1 Tax=Hasllibacter sp. MH4015 TaxID=2854029 RepID=UPI001CD63D12|nr:HAD-IA family hydrolase [Hasllibacter sp. MH4015]